MSGQNFLFIFYSRMVLVYIMLTFINMTDNSGQHVSKNVFLKSKQHKKLQTNLLRVILIYNSHVTLVGCDISLSTGMCYCGSVLTSGVSVSYGLCYLNIQGFLLTIVQPLRCPVCILSAHE